ALSWAELQRRQESRARLSPAPRDQDRPPPADASRKNVTHPRAPQLSGRMMLPTTRCRGNLRMGHGSGRPLCASFSWARGAYLLAEDLDELVGRRPEPESQCYARTFWLLGSASMTSRQNIRLRDRIEAPQVDRLRSLSEPRGCARLAAATGWGFHPHRRADWHTLDAVAPLQLDAEICSEDPRNPNHRIPNSGAGARRTRSLKFQNRFWLAFGRADGVRVHPALDVRPWDTARDVSISAGSPSRLIFAILHAVRSNRASKRQTMHTLDITRCAHFGPRSSRARKVLRRV